MRIGARAPPNRRERVARRSFVHCDAGSAWSAPDDTAERPCPPPNALGSAASFCAHSVSVRPFPIPGGTTAQRVPRRGAEIYVSTARREPARRARARRAHRALPPRPAVFTRRSTRRSRCYPTRSASRTRSLHERGRSPNLRERGHWHVERASTIKAGNLRRCRIGKHQACDKDCDPDSGIGRHKALSFPPSRKPIRSRFGLDRCAFYPCFAIAQVILRMTNSPCLRTWPILHNLFPLAHIWFPAYTRAPVDALGQLGSLYPGGFNANLRPDQRSGYLSG